MVERNCPGKEEVQEKMREVLLDAEPPATSARSAIFYGDLVDAVKAKYSDDVHQRCRGVVARHVRLSEGIPPFRRTRSGKVYYRE